ncbi:protein MOS2 [Solanum dulcamara]|uniref:protein MOS2 n=1 Tax=Solanum dulcamara TaxID=45834 RepID=UPI002486954F|nr:protein MOS2 [Solanum dulcamara]XP_055820796.1 protein MOS2 [Solanum dulcamara]XP_055820797.1 protein MOS2 [Solanum dulcamara]
MKLSFSLSSKPSSNLKKNPSSQTFSGDDPRSSSNPIEKEYLTEFDPSKAAASSTKDTLIIPPKQNEWRPIKRMKNLEVPLQADVSAADQPLQFELDSGAAVEPSSDGISYGLNVRQSENPNSNPNPNPSLNPNPNPNPNPKQTIDPMLHKFKEDLKRLPEHNGIDEYTDMPVEGFGAALLKGYGWVEGRGIGRNAKEDVKVVEYKRWTAKEGIGFIPEVPKSNSKGEGGVKPIKSKGEEGVKVDHSDGNVEKIDREKGGKGLYAGKEVRVVRGKEMGMKGKIVEVKSSRDLVILKLADKEVKLQARDLAELGSVEEERCLKKLLELKIKEEKSNLDGVRKLSSGGRSRDEARTERKKESRRSRDEGSDKVSWLASHIRVRIISKDLKRGRLYLKKGEIMDVVGLTSCDICMDETRELIQGVDQELLETALPKRGGPVLVLYGRHKGVYGHLVEKDSENETGIVRDGDTKELLKVRLEQIAEYLGDPSYIGY